jgi:perosamine synthetase
MKKFELKSTFGQHKILKIDSSYHKFKEYFIDLFKYEKLEQLHLKSKDYDDNKDKLTEGGLSDIDTDLHKIFYKDIKTNNNFKKLYCELIKDIYDNLFPSEDIFIFQSYPSIRIQYHENIVIPPHYDSDDLGKHPIGEKNFILPVTRMYGTNTIFIESEPRKEDFQPLEAEYGDLLYFNGNKCMHFNKENKETDIRISLDFRILLLEDYLKYLENYNITFTNPRDQNRVPVKMTIGGYYQMCFKNKIYNIENWYSNKNLILQSRPNFDIKEADAVYEYMKGDNFYTEFKYTTQLENIIANYIGSKYCIMVNNGTVSLVLALLALDIGKDDEVIVPNYTMIASINAIKILGAIPIIVDVDSETFTINLEDIKKNITNKTKGIMHVTLNNRTKDLDKIANFCNDNNIYLIEDAAQSLGCFLNKKHIGTFGKIGSFSLSTPKIISTGQGGFLVTDDYNLFKKMSMIKNFGRKEGGIDDFETFGLNFKFTDIQAIIGIEQMKKLDWRVKRMREMFDLYYNELKNVVQILPAQNDEWIPWFIEIIINNRDELINFLKHHNIQSRKTYPQINETIMYKNDNTYLNSQYISNNGLFLPSHTLLKNEDIIYICDIIKLFFNNK